MSTDKNNAELSKLISLLGVTLSGNICYNCRPSSQYKDEDAIICATANYLLANGVSVSQPSATSPLAKCGHFDTISESDMMPYCPCCSAKMKR